MAVISLDLPSTATWPSVRPVSAAHRLTVCRQPSWPLPPREPRKDLPSICSRFRPRRPHTAFIQATKHSWKATGSRAAKTRLKVSCDGMPWGRARKRAIRQLLLELLLPQPRAAAVAAAPVTQDQQLVGPGVRPPAHLPPPAGDSIHGELRGVGRQPDVDPALVAARVVQPVRH